VAWPGHEAKQRFDRVVEAARTEGGSLKDALRALGEADHGGFAAILEHVVSERRRSSARDVADEE
jgi:hypothetical protein